jgi:GNAT superfamily N-acetyltransferase
MTLSHELLDLLISAARGRFPPADWSVDVMGEPPGPADAVVALTAHHVIASSVGRAEILDQLPSGELDGPMQAAFLSWLGTRLATRPGMIDVVLAADPHGHDGPPLREQPELATHPRVQRATRYRTDVRLYSDLEQRGVVILGRGLAGRWEVSIEVDPEYRAQGVGRLLASAARDLQDEMPLFAQVSPGNTASLRTLLAAGFRPIGGEVLFLRRGPGT